MRSGEKKWQIVLAAVCIIYVCLRLWHLTDSCLWFDEIFSVHAAEHSLSSIFGFVAQDLIHPPLFYLFLKFWIFIGGESLFWLRFFPVFFSCAALVPLILLGRALKLNYLSISLAVLFLAVNGAMIKYAQEVRMYSVLFCLSLFSIWLFTRFFYLGKNIWILTIINLLLIYTHYFGWLIVFSEIAVILIFQLIKIRQTLIMFGILLAGFAPWIFAIWKATEKNADFAQNIGWIPKPNLETFYIFLFDLIEPFYFQQSTIEPTTIFAVTIPLLFLILISFILLIVQWLMGVKQTIQDFYLLLSFILLPIFAAFAASWLLPYSIWGTRHLIFVFPLSAILLATVLEKIEFNPLKIGLISLILFIVGISFTVQIQRETPVYIWCAWENLAQTLDKTQKTKIYVFEDLVAYDFWFALRDSQENFEIIKVNSEEMPEDKAYFLPRGFDAIRTTTEQGIEGEKFYIAFRDAEFNEHHPPLHNLIKKGYKIGAPTVFETVGLKGFLVEVQK